MPAASIVFTAHNRRDMLLDAVRLAKGQTVALEIIVMDDASTDGTREAMAAHHPDVAYVRSERAMGPCYQRNHGVRLATCAIVLVLDDDAMLQSPRTAAQTIADFADPATAIVAMPFRNILQSPVVHHRHPDPDSQASFVNHVACAHAVRREPYLSVGGYEELYFYMGEENDLAIRLIAAGYRIMAGSADPVDHLQPPQRRSYRADFYGRRNKILFYWLRCPGRQLPVRIAGAVAKGLAFGARNGSLKAAVLGMIDGARTARRHPQTRAAVAAPVFAKFMRDRDAKPVPLD